MSKAQGLSKIIKEKAYAIGFDLVGISSAEPLFKAREVLRKRQLSSFIAQDIQLLTTPRLHLASARSVIVLALSYAQQNNWEEDAYIAAYARGRDYHRVLKEKMAILMDFILQEKPAADLKAYVDTAPLLERELAQRAGLGWIGKNNNLINPHYGSYLVLGEILTSLELAEDGEMSSKCGDCTRCLEACPGKALEKPYQLNPDRCISQLSQERGFLPWGKRRLMGQQLWGCDRCQQVCPYNQDIPRNLHSEFQTQLRGDFAVIFNLSPRNLSPVWKNSALLWRGIRILKRNALINIANSKNRDYLNYILESLQASSPVLRAYAVWALGEVLGKEAEAYLLDLAAWEKEAVVQEEIQRVKNKYLEGWSDEIKDKW